MLPSFLYFLPFLTCQSCHHFEHSFAGISRNNLQILAGLWCHPNIWVELLVVHGSHCTTMPTDCQAFPLSPPQIKNIRAAASPGTPSATRSPLCAEDGRRRTWAY